MESKTSPWDLYDRLIEGVPAEVRVVDYCLGKNWSCVKAESGAGVAYTFPGGATASGVLPDYRGGSLRDLAAQVKSWCFPEASLGAAALNAWYATRDKLDIEAFSLATGPESGGFALLLKQIEQRAADFGHVGPADKPNVAVIGHFPHMNDLERASHLTVLERNPRMGDLPDPACEYVLPEQDYVLMTGTTFTNKTMPRLLELSRNAKVYVVGPSTPLLPVLFDYGVDVLAGRFVDDPDQALRSCETGERFGSSFVKCAVMRA